MSILTGGPERPDRSAIVATRSPTAPGGSWRSWLAAWKVPPEAEPYDQDEADGVIVAVFVDDPQPAVVQAPAYGVPPRTVRPGSFERIAAGRRDVAR